MAMVNPMRWQHTMYVPGSQWCSLALADDVLNTQRVDGSWEDGVVCALSWLNTGTGVLESPVDFKLVVGDEVANAKVSEVTQQLEKGPEASAMVGPASCACVAESLVTTHNPLPGNIGRC